MLWLACFRPQSPPHAPYATCRASDRPA